MKKTIIPILILSIILSSMTASCDTQPEDSVESTFEIYLATAESAREFGCSSIEKLVLEEEPVITGEDIRSYYWEQHVVEVTSEFAKEVYEKDNDQYDEYSIDENGLRQYEKGGSRLLGSAQYMCFVVVVDGKRVYSGTFTGSTYVPQTPDEIIIGDVAENRFAIIYNVGGFDRRNDDAVYEYFKDAGKMEKIPEDISEQMLEEMQNRIDAFESRYALLQERYDALEDKVDDYEDELDAREALEDWQRERLRLYMLETQENSGHEAFCRLLEGLDMTDVGSISKAADFFRQSATSSDYVNDRMFNVFEEFFNIVIEGIPVYNGFDEIDEEFISSAYSNGVVVSVEGGRISAAPRNSYLKANFELFLSEELNEYLSIIEFELSIAKNNDAMGIVENNNLSIDMKGLADLIYRWGKFAKERPYNFPFNYKAKEKAERYMDIFIGRESMDESPVYDIQSGELLDEAKEAYLHFINKYKDSTYYEIITELYVLLEGNAFIFNDDIKEYVKALDFRTQ